MAANAGTPVQAVRRQGTPSTPARKRSSLAGSLLLGAVLVYVAVLVMVPVLAPFPKAFAQGIGPVLQSLARPDALAALRLTFLLALVAVVINAVFGMVLAMVLARQQFWGKSVVNAIINMPFVVSPVIVGFMFLVLFGKNGWFEPLVNFFVQLARYDARHHFRLVAVCMPRSAAGSAGAWDRA